MPLFTRSVYKRLCVITCLFMTLFLVLMEKYTKPSSRTKTQKESTFFLTVNYSPTEYLPLSGLYIKSERRMPNCTKLFTGDPSEMQFIAEYIKEQVPSIRTPEEVVRSTSDCNQYIRTNRYLTEPTTEEEADFPIAFVITVYIDIGHLERLLRALYSPQNLYCIHVDLNAQNDYLIAVHSLARCFDNVFLSSNRSGISWGRWEVVEAHLHCMRDLVSSYWGKWKYLINLTGHEFPLQTNYVLTKALKAYNGSNDFSGSFREGKRFKRRLSTNLSFGLDFVKGELHGLFTRKFVKFLLENPEAQAVIETIKKHVAVPDESVFQMLHFNPSLNAPGGFNGTDDQATRNWDDYWPVRYKHWSGIVNMLPYINYTCFGGYEKGICQYGLLDVQNIMRNARERGFLFLNKLRGSPHIVYDCIEQDFFERRKTQNLKEVDTSLWSNRDAAKFGRGDGL